MALVRLAAGMVLLTMLLRVVLIHLWWKESCGDLEGLLKVCGNQAIGVLLVLDAMASTDQGCCTANTSQAMK